MYWLQVSIKLMKILCGNSESSGLYYYYYCNVCIIVVLIYLQTLLKHRLMERMSLVTRSLYLQHIKQIISLASEDSQCKPVYSLFEEGRATHCSVDEHPQELAPKCLQELAIVELTQCNLLLQDMVLQNDLQEALVHGHHLI